MGNRMGGARSQADGGTPPQNPQAGSENDDPQHVNPQAGGSGADDGDETMTVAVARELRRENQTLRNERNTMRGELDQLKRQFAALQGTTPPAPTGQNNGGTPTDFQQVAQLLLQQQQQFQQQMTQQLQQQQRAAQEAGAVAKFQASAERAGCKNVQALTMMLDRSQILYDAAGQPLNVQQLLADLKRDVPDLFKVAGGGQADSGAGNGRASGNGKQLPHADMNTILRRAAGRA